MQEQCPLALRMGSSQFSTTLHGIRCKCRQYLQAPVPTPSTRSRSRSRSPALCCTCWPGIHDTFRQYQALTKAIEAMYGPLRAPSGGGGGLGQGGASGGGGGPVDAGGAAAAAGPPPTFQQWEEHMDQVSKDNTTLHDAWALMLGAVPGESRAGWVGGGWTA